MKWLNVTCTYGTHVANSSIIFHDEKYSKRSICIDDTTIIPSQPCALSADQSNPSTPRTGSLHRLTVASCRAAQQGDSLGSAVDATAIQPVLVRLAGELRSVVRRVLHEDSFASMC